MKTSRGYDLEPVDVFACGLILFLMYAGHPPFRKATQTDSWYKFFAAKKPDLFWSYHDSAKEKTHGPGFYTEDFKTLCSNIFVADPAKRFTIKNIKESSWYKGEVADDETVAKEFARYKSQLNDYFQAEKEERKKEKMKHIQESQENAAGQGQGAFNGFKAYRDVSMVIQR